jgi:acid phosphatase family membrane protein YuiD
MNQDLFLWLNHVATRLPDWFWASLTISGHASMAFALLSPLLLRNQSINRIFFSALFICAILSGLVVKVLKESFQIARPPAVLAAEQFHLIGDKLDKVSFPSGHTLTVFAVVTLLIFVFRLRGFKLLAVLFAAALVGLSRIAVGAHWPLDVLGGAVVGVICAWASLQAAWVLHRRTAWSASPMYIGVQAAVILAASASLFITDMGYPEAKIWQMLIATFGCLLSAYALFLALKSSKLR